LEFGFYSEEVERNELVDEVEVGKNVDFVAASDLEHFQIAAY
jgi:hypothetical protein